ncbi:MAG: hypothetical protein LUH17_02200 [Acidaminococcaceae bacterium]|nr:hypothetical protein [Acidaminococcaceae bacterium]
MQRDQNGCRNYMEADKEWVQFLCKLKATGMLLRDIKTMPGCVMQGPVLLPNA